MSTLREVERWAASADERAAEGAGGAAAGFGGAVGRRLVDVEDRGLCPGLREAPARGAADATAAAGHEHHPVCQATHAFHPRWQGCYGNPMLQLRRYGKGLTDQLAATDPETERARFCVTYPGEQAGIIP